MALNRESFQKAISILVIITPIALSFLATRVPLEDYLSEIGLGHSLVGMYPGEEQLSDFSRGLLLALYIMAVKN